MPVTIHTIGHGNRSADEFRGLLQHAGVTRLADVRAHPGSRRHPQFSQAALAHDLPVADVAYRWDGPALGGRRRSRQQSRNVALRNASFRAYADHMQTPEFRTAMNELMGRASSVPTAIMCAERLPWHCHRYLISDYLVAHGTEVVHLISPGAAREHALNRVARVENGIVVYDQAEQGELGLPAPRRD
jgi:uncharacterized protein (DUF488 family)